MSLDVPAPVLHAAEYGPVDDAAFLAVVRASLATSAVCTIGALHGP